MKWILHFVALLLSFSAIHAQNIGIGIQMPQAKLDVRGSLRTGGTANYLLYDSATGRFTWNNSHLYLPATQYVLRHSASSEGLFYNAGKLHYLNSIGDPVFYTDWNTGNGYFGGNLGIGQSNPTTRLHVGAGTVRIEGPAMKGDVSLSLSSSGEVQVDAPFVPAGRFVIKENGNVGIGNNMPGFPLNFSPVHGDKISLWGNDGSHYGFGIQNNLLQIHTDDASSDIAFGYGSSSVFTEGVRIKGTGNVGIGNQNPAYLLDLSGRMRLRSGGNLATSAGLWLNNNANTEAAFVGMEDDTHVGFFGNSAAGWKFSMNTQTGALKVAGSEGQAGKVLTSTGGLANTWTSPTNFMYNNTYTALQTSSFEFSGYMEVPGIARTLTTPKCKAQIIVKGNIANAGCFGCPGRIFKFDLVIDGALADRSLSSIGNGAEMIVTNGAYIAELTPGSHTFSVFVDGNGSSHIAQSFRMVILLIPE